MGPVTVFRGPFEPYTAEQVANLMHGSLAADWKDPASGALATACLRISVPSRSSIIFAEGWLRGWKEQASGTPSTAGLRNSGPCRSSTFCAEVGLRRRSSYVRKLSCEAGRFQIHEQFQRLV